MDQVPWFDRIEKTGRVILWLSIASACVIVPIAYTNQKRAETRAEADLQASVKRSEAKVEELENASKPHRLTLASMGTYLSALNYTTSQGSLWFTNVSARAGTVCVVGTTQDAELTIKTAESLAACQDVAAYASGVHMTMMFAGGDLNAACPKTNCRLTIKDAPEAP
jgi:hypothetical protein